MSNESQPQVDPNSEAINELGLAEDLTSARIDLEKAEAAKEVIDELGIQLSDEESAKLEEAVAAKGDWVDYLSTRDFKGDNGAVRRSDGTLKSFDEAKQARNDDEKLYEDSLEAEYKDQGYAELGSILIDAEKSGDKTIVEEVNDAIIEKIAADAERNGFSEEQTDRLYDRIVALHDKQREAHEQEQASSQGEKNTSDESGAVDGESEPSITESETSAKEADKQAEGEKNTNENGEAEKQEKPRSGWERVKWYGRNINTTTQMAFARLQQLPGQAIEGLSKLYTKEDGEKDKKKIAKHVIIGAAVAGSVVVLAIGARKLGAEKSVIEAVDAMNGTSIDFPSPPALEISPPKGNTAHFAEVLPQNPIIAEQANVLGDIADKLDSMRPWDVAKEVAKVTGKTTRAVLEEGIDKYNASNGANFELVHNAGTEMFMDGQHIVNPTEELAINQVISSLVS